MGATRPGPVPLVPEVRLHQAEASAGDAFIDLWARTEADGGGPQPPPFWAFAWAGGQALARHVLDHPEAVRGRAVVDLAAGSGLVAVAAAIAGAGAVTAVEIDPLAVAAARANAELAGVALRSLLADLLDPADARPDAGAARAALAAADVVLAGDVFYEREMAGQVLGLLDAAAARGVLVLVGDPGRAYLPRRRLEAVAVHDVPVPRALEDADVKRTTVWRVPPPT